MKSFLLIPLLLTISLPICLAQDTKNWIRQSQQIRKEYGETSTKYLAALDSVILHASMNEQLDVALSYRKKHLAIINNILGDRSIEYADDLTRIGNTTYRKEPDKPEKALPYYLQADTIYKQNPIIENSLYTYCLGQISDIYVALNQYDKAFAFQELYADQIKSNFGTQSNIYLSASQRAAAIAQACGKFDKALEYCDQITNIIDGNITADIYPYYKSLSDIKQACLWSKGQHTEAIREAIEFARITKQLTGERSLEYTSSLTVIADRYAEESALDRSANYYRLAAALLESMFQDKKSLYDQDLYYDIIRALAIISSDKAKKYEYEKLIREILKSREETDSTEYGQNLKALFMTAKSLGEYNYAISIAQELEDLIPNFSDSPNEDYYYLYGYLCDIYNQARDYNQALTFCDKTLMLVDKVFSGENKLYNKAQIYYGKAQILDLCNQREQAADILKEAFRLNAQLPQDNLNVILQRGGLLQERGSLTLNYEDGIRNFDEAIALYEAQKDTIQRKADTIFHQQETTDENADVISELSRQIANIDNRMKTALTNRGMKHYNKGNFESAYDDFQQVSQILTSYGDTYSGDYITLQNNLALCEMATGKDIDAIQRLDHVYEIVTSRYGKMNYLYATCLLNYGLYYQHTFDYQALIKYTLEAADILKKWEGENGQNYAKCLCNLGLAYIALKDPDQAEPVLNEAYSIFSKKMDIESKIMLSTVLNNLANLYCMQGRYQDADMAFKNCSTIMIDTYGQNSIEYATLLASYGYQCVSLKLDTAEEIFRNALNILYDLKMTTHPLVPYCILMYGLACAQSNIAPMEEYPQYTIEMLHDYYSGNFAFYTETDRSRVWRILQNLQNILFSTQTQDFNSLYDYCLYSKSLLLATSINFSQSILESGDKSLIDEYAQLKSIQETLHKRKGLPTLSNTGLPDLSDACTHLERVLISKVKELADYSQDLNYTTTDLTTELTSTDVAVEFVDYVDLKTDKTQYVALVLRNNWDRPKMISLCSKDELEQLNRINLEDEKWRKNSFARINLDKRYFQKGYSLIWAKLEPYINEGDDVYFSPSGLLHQINVEVLKDSTGRQANVKYNLYRVSSTRQLCIKKPEIKYTNAALYGGLIYEMDSTQMIAQSRAYHSTDDYVASRGFVVNSTMRKGWRYLSATKSEVEIIARQMREHRIRPERYTEAAGTEESFKALSGKHIPIIHLATHGFFLKNEEAQKQDYFQAFNLEQSKDIEDNSLKRSGLILAGGQRAWLNQPIPANVEDGILLAEEIATMDLSGTDLVVLSACQTGLGEITSEGVFGLQRAFKKAGVQTLIMSLWKVDDSATSLMMQTFYEHLLSGQSKREAFAIAQQAVKEKHNDPYYWAAFIMLD